MGFCAAPATSGGGDICPQRSSTSARARLLYLWSIDKVLRGLWVRGEPQPMMGPIPGKQPEFRDRGRLENPLQRLGRGPRVRFDAGPGGNSNRWPGRPQRLGGPQQTGALCTQDHCPTWPYPDSRAGRTEQD